MADFLLEGGAVGSFADVSGFGPVEISGSARWRWAHGNRQIFPFELELGLNIIRYQIFFPIAGTKISFSCEGANPLQLQSTEEKDVLGGFWEIYNNSSAKKVAPVRVTVESAPEKILNIPDCEPVLSYSVEKFQTWDCQEVKIDVRAEVDKVIASNIVPSSFCSLPFMQLYLDEEGHFYPCCEAKEEIIQSGLYGFEKVGLAESQPENVWNSSSMRKMRREMLAGVRPSACRKCFYNEDRGASSYRTIVNSAQSAYLPYALKALESITENGSISALPALVDVRLGNVCNLRCRMCKPASSVALADEFSELYGRNFSRFKQIDWHRTESSAEKIAQQCLNARELNIAGGEPFATPELPGVLQAIIDLGAARRIHLRLITNGTILNQKVLALFPFFEKVTISISLDGTKEVNEYVRYPSVFEQIDKNLKYLHENMKSLNIVEVNFNTTVQVYNIFDLPNLFRYLAKFPKFKWFPNLSLLTIPDFFSVLILPAGIRAKAKELLSAYQKEVGGSSPIVRDRVEGVIKYLDGESLEYLLPRFRELSAAFDRKRSQARPRLPGLDEIF